MESPHYPSAYLPNGKFTHVLRSVEKKYCTENSLHEPNELFQLEVAFLVSLGDNPKYGSNIGLLRRYFKVLLPTAPAVSVDLATGIVAVSHRENLQYGENIGLLRSFFKVLLPTAPAVSVELAMGTVAVSYPAISGIGVRLMLFFLFGAIIFCFGYKQALKILTERAALYMKEYLTTYKDEHRAENILAVETWNTMMREGGYHCCGLNGYRDFTDKFKMPTPCCSMDDNVLAESCSYNTAAAMYPAVPGCTGKINIYFELIRPRFTVLAVSLLMPPVRFLRQSFLWTKLNLTVIKF
ncbi:unnamed protein product [Dibothriocephalus latus]|uniref:Tetraspanin n=1 Tax=Dibothriocephalus latus TaxID=60516 RepID=A0A3P7MFU5_DIBLA|nr:unnamed protein product [Dibothriocephalus latus]